MTLLSIGPRYGFSLNEPLLGKRQTETFNLVDVAATFRLPWSCRQRGGYATGPHRPILVPLVPLISNLGANQHSTMEKEKDGEGDSKQCKHCIRDSKDGLVFEQVRKSRLQI